MRIFLFPAVLAGMLFPAAALAEPHSLSSAVADVCVYGGTAAGVMGAVAAKREGKSVIIVEPARALGRSIGGGTQVNQDTGCEYRTSGPATAGCPLFNETSLLSPTGLSGAATF